MRIINLLPWRTLQAQHAKKNFLLALLITSLALLALSIATYMYLTQQKNDLQQQVQQLQAIEKTQTEKQLLAMKQSQQLQKQSEQLTELQTLQQRRYFLAQLLELLANQLPAGIYLTALKQQDGILLIEGRATHQAAITQFIMLLTSIPDLKSAELHEVKSIANTQQLEFSIHVTEILAKQEVLHGTALG
jgi:type IV pilus assembly protein PilN